MYENPLLRFYYVSEIIHGKNDFVKISKELNTDLKIILLNYQNNYVKHDE